MKIFTVKAVLLFFIVLLVMGCNLSMSDDLDAANRDSDTKVMDVSVEGIPEAGARVAIGSDTAVTAVYLTAFQTSTRAKLNFVDNDTTPNVTNGIVTLTHAGSGQPWRTGGITLPATGGVTFLAYAVNSGGQHLYSAPSTITDISNLATNPSLTADTGYTVGGFGPAGGYIAYSSSNHYIEVAPKGWSGTLGTTADPVATIWGPSMAGGTTVQNTAIGTGKDNTSAFNSKITGTTYKVASGNTLNASGTGYAVNDVLSIDNTFGGQVKVATLSGTAVATIAGGANNIKGATSSAAGSFATTNVTHPGVGTGCTITIALNTTSYSNFAFARAKVANTNAVNGYTDWMLPSSAEMTQIYTAFSSAPATYGLVAAGWYWSSTEVAATIANAWAIQFSASKTITSKVKTTSTYLVHPARYF